MDMLDGEARRGDIQCDRRARRWNYDSHASLRDNMICVYWLRFTQGSSTAIALRGLPGAGIYTARAGKASGIVGAIAPGGWGQRCSAILQGPALHRLHQSHIVFVGRGQLFPAHAMHDRIFSSVSGWRSVATSRISRPDVSSMSISKPRRGRIERT